MSLVRRALPLLLAAILVMAGPAAVPAVSAPDYRGPVDITFPAVPSARYSNDFANPRSGGRVHRATDLFASAGTRIYAARGGVVVWSPAQESGNAGFAVQIRGDDGRVYAYYHLGPAGGTRAQAVARRVKLGATIARGQVIGWLGDSGNARGGSPHLHFEIHDSAVTDPYGSNRRNPYNSLRRAQGLPIDMSTNPVVTPPPPTSTTGSKVLRLGSRGKPVKKWQLKLTRTGRVGTIGADGVFGPATHRATVAFQRSAGLGPAGLGVVGPNTRAAMRRVLRAVRTGKTSPPKRPTVTKPTAPRRSAGATLRLGSRGQAVKVWQRRLNRSGMTAKVGRDGVFGPATHRATVTFQRKVGLGPAGLGVVGPKTRAAMQRVLRSR